MTHSLSSGQNVALSSLALTVQLVATPGRSFRSQVDFSAFLLSAAGKVRSDADFVFYGQTRSTLGEVAINSSGLSAQVTIDLAKVSADVDKIALTAVVDGQDSFSALDGLSVQAKDAATGDILYQVPVSGMSEKALILAQVYRHQSGWKIKAVGQGFNGGLGPLATSYGVDIEEPTVPAAGTPSSSPSNSAPAAISLEKKIERDAPHLISLVKPLRVSLEKNRLTGVKARVAFSLDVTGSMKGQFSKGYVQSVLERITVLAAQLDDDGAMDFWGYAEKHRKYEDVTLANVKGYIDRIRSADRSFFSGHEIFPGLGACNDEPPMLKSIIEHFKHSQEPVFVVVITDGGISQARAIKAAIAESANYPIFWKFVGLGGRNYGVLEELDNFTSRRVDNTDFFAIDDFAKISNEVLYERLLTEFSGWLSKAKQMGILRG